MQHKVYFAITVMLLASCTSFEDAELTERKTFAHFYSSASDYTGTVAELDGDGGFILSGEIRNSDGTTDGLIIKTDARGHKVWERVMEQSVAKAILPTVNGYILAGDSVQLDAGSTDVHELSNTFARLVIMDAQGNITDKHITKSSIQRTVNNQQVTLNVDYHADAIALDANGRIIMLGSYRVPDENEASYVAAFAMSDISDSLWQKSYRSLEHHYMNANSVFVTPSSSIVWASKMYTSEQNLGREFLSVPNVGPNSAPINHSLYGESDQRNHSVADMQKSSVGYCAIGTYAEPSGLNANIYFVRINNNLDVMPETARYIDGQQLLLNNTLLTEATTSSSIDEGLAVTATDDGFLIAGSLTTNPTVGNGGKDILLIKLDPFGNLLWKKLMGGSGDEVISSIRQTSDKGFLLFGTNTINGLSSMMLLKTDENGDITN